MILTTLYLSEPDADNWRHIAFTRCLGWFNQANMQDAEVIDRFKRLFGEASNTSFSQIADDLLEKPAVGGLGWIGDEGIVRVLCAIPLRAINDLNTRAMVVNTSLDMSKKGTDAEFRPVWAGYFHLLNLLQFLPAMQFGTVDGIKSGLYEPIEFKFGITALGLPVDKESGHDPAMEQVGLGGRKTGCTGLRTGGIPQGIRR
jgi:hypothetical protein